MNFVPNLPESLAITHPPSSLSRRLFVRHQPRPRPALPLFYTVPMTQIPPPSHNLVDDPAAFHSSAIHVTAPIPAKLFKLDPLDTPITHCPGSTSPQSTPCGVLDIQKKFVEINKFLFYSQVPARYRSRPTPNRGRKRGDQVQAGYKFGSGAD